MNLFRYPIGMGCLFVFFACGLAWSQSENKNLLDSNILELPIRNIQVTKEKKPQFEMQSSFIRRIPSTMNDPIRAISFAPGVTVQNDVNVRPYVRGGNADQTRVVLNGLPLLQPFHVGGVFSMFNLNTIESVQLDKEAFPVGDPGTLSGDLQLKSKNKIPSKTHLTADLSLVRGDIYVETPLVANKLSVYGAGQAFLFNRSLHGLMDVTSTFSRDSGFQADMQGYRDHINMPDFTDLHFGAAFTPTPNFRTDYMGSSSSDKFEVVVPKQTNVLSRINPNFGDPTAALPPEPVNPANPKPKPKKISVDSISNVSIGNQMHFLNSTWDMNDEHTIENSFGFQTQNWDVGFKHATGSNSKLNLSQSAQYYNYRFADTYSPSEKNHFTFGFAYDHKYQRYHMNLPYVLYDVIVNGNVDMLEPLGNVAEDGFTLLKTDSSRNNFDYLGEFPSRINFTHQGNLSEDFGSVFFSHSLKTENGLLTYGLRGEYQNTSNEFFPAPRLDYRWKMNATNELYFSSGIYSQNNLPFYERDRNTALKSEKSGQLGLEWTHHFSKGYRTSINSYYKRFTDLVSASLVPDRTIDLKALLIPLPSSKLSTQEVDQLRSILDTTSQFSSLPDSIQNAAYENFGGLIYQYSNTGTGNCYGTEFSFFYEPNAIWNGWVTADFSISNRQDGPDQRTYDYRYHRPIVLNWVNAFAIPGGFDLSLTYRWAMGQPYTPYSGEMEGKGSLDPIIVGSKNSGRLAPYSRLDMRLSRDAHWWKRNFKMYLEVWNSMNTPNYFARDNTTGELKSAQLNWPFPLLFLGVSGDI